MPHKFWRLVLIAILAVALTAPARAESTATAGKEVVVGIVAVSAAIAVGITLLVLHAKHKRSSITGCVTSGAGGLTITDERDKRVYSLTGNPVGVKPGDQMTLEGKQLTGGQTPVFEAGRVTKDFGVCHP
jgi:hypothetical protein